MENLISHNLEFSGEDTLNFQRALGFIILLLQQVTPTLLLQIDSYQTIFCFTHRLQGIW